MLAAVSVIFLSSTSSARLTGKRGGKVQVHRMAVTDPTGNGGNGVGFLDVSSPPLTPLFSCAVVLNARRLELQAPI